MKNSYRPRKETWGIIWAIRGLQRKEWPAGNEILSSTLWPSIHHLLLMSYAHLYTIVYGYSYYDAKGNPHHMVMQITDSEWELGILSILGKTFTRISEEEFQSLQSR